MKITEKELKKLNQLDRIEFRQRYEILESQEINESTFDTFFWGLFITWFISVGIYLIKGYFANIVMLLPRLMFLYVILSLALKLIINIRIGRNKDRLKEEYFKQEIKKK